MERGTEWERQAVHERWAAMEQHHALVTRLLGGFSLLGGGVILLLLAVARGACMTTAGGGTIECTPTSQPPLSVVLTLWRPRVEWWTLGLLDRLPTLTTPLRLPDIGMMTEKSMLCTSHAFHSVN